MSRNRLRRFSAAAIMAALSAGLVPVASVAQEASGFSGRVIEESSGAPVAGAVISIVGATGTARTDSDGRFQWQPVPAVPAQVIVVLPGGQVARPVTIDTIAEGLTIITVASLADESVTVLGAAPSIQTSPGAARSILSGTQIAQGSPEHLMQALESVPGVNQVSEGHAGVPAVRGMARGRTLVLIDGARVTSERRVGPSATFMDPSVIEGIDIARGPGSVAYGSDALGGVISIRTRRAEAGSPLHARISGTIGGGVPEARGAVEVSKGLARGGLLVQVHARNTEDYDAPSGEVFNSGWEDRGLLATFNHQISRGLFSAVWQSDLGRDVERPRDNSRTVRFYYPFEDSHRFTASYEVPDVAGFERLSFTGFLGSYEQRTDQDRGATATISRSIERADISAKDFHVKGTAERLVRNARLELGVDVNGRFGLEAFDILQHYDLAGTLTNDTTNVSIDTARRIDTGVFVQAEAAVARLARLSSGVRVDRVTSTNSGGSFGDRSVDNSAASGFGAATLGPFERLTVTAQVSRGFREPLLSDRYFRGPSGRGFITGNPDLEPETSLQVDLGTRYTFARTQVGLFFYRYQISDLIERFQTETDFFFFRNRGRARIQGFEVEARSDFGDGYSVQMTANIVRGTALDEDADLDDIAPDTVSVSGRKAFGAGVYVQTRLAVSADDNRPGPSEVASPGAMLLDIGGGWRVMPQLEIRAMVRNLLNDEYYASPDPRWV
ncbi:MAG: TonB-dependent receptor, partial [Vicinamibacterales bacterium]